MSIESINGADSTSSLWWLEAIKKKEETSTNTDTTVTTATQAAATLDVSPMGQMMSRLDSLSTSDPEKFKEVTSEIADKLTEAASSATGRDAEFLKGLASQFATASETGDVSALQPPERPQHGHGPSRYESGQSDATDGTTAPPPPPPPDGASGWPSDSVRSTLDDIFQMVSQL
jgi:hypothetical protein